MTRRLARLTAAAGLSLALLLTTAGRDLLAAGPKDVQKYTDQLRKAKDAKEKVAAIDELGKLGQIQKALVKDVMPDIVKALGDKDAAVRAAAAKAYGMTDPDPKEAIPALMKLVKDDKEEAVKIAAIRGLAAMGTGAKDASKDLQKIGKDEGKDSKLGKAAKDAVKTISGKN